jgi:hypothetical protein
VTEHISPASNLKELTTAVATLPRIVEHTTSMYQLASTCEAIARTTKKTEKARILAHYFRSRPIDEAVLAAVYLSGRVFPG